MITDHTVESLQAFEADIAMAFNDRLIRAPIHLEGGNEQPLIDIFEDIQPNDWVCGSWRMHYKCLLKGVPPSELKQAILAGRSITLCFPEYRIISSAIVGGILPIAVGLAWTIKRQNSDEYVWTFVGDMTARSGIYHECREYVENYNLPINFITEDNGLSVCTPTKETWGVTDFPTYWSSEQYYKWKLPWPHSGAGVRVNF